MKKLILLITLLIFTTGCSDSEYDNNLQEETIAVFKNNIENGSFDKGEVELESPLY